MPHTKLSIMECKEKSGLRGEAEVLFWAVENGILEPMFGSLLEAAGIEKSATHAELVNRLEAALNAESGVIDLVAQMEADKMRKAYVTEESRKSLVSLGMGEDQLEKTIVSHQEIVKVYARNKVAELLDQLSANQSNLLNNDRQNEKDPP